MEGRDQAEIVARAVSLLESFFTRVDHKLRQTVLDAAFSGHVKDPRKLAQQLGKRARQTPAAPLPLLVSLGDWTGSQPFGAFVAGRLPEGGDTTLALSRVGRLILLLDGLNEIPTGDRGDKAKQIERFIHQLQDETPVFVSCRSDDYQDELDLGLDTLSLEPLSPPRIREVLAHWFALSGRTDAADAAHKLFWQLAGDLRLADVLQTWLSAGATEDQFWKAEEIPSEQPDVQGNISWEESKLWYQHVRDPRSLIRLAANP